MNSIAILGGTFDPVHCGHLRLAIQLHQQVVDRVLLLPNRVPPHRLAPIATPAQRLDMLTLAVSELDGIEVSSLELDSDHISYSVHSARALRQQYPEHSLTWVMGADAWHGFDQWQQAEELLQLVNVLVINRPGQPQPSWEPVKGMKYRIVTDETLNQYRAGGVCHLQWPELEIAASDLRQALAKGDNIRFLTPDPVLNYINHNKLYS